MGEDKKKLFMKRNTYHQPVSDAQFCTVTPQHHDISPEKKKKNLLEGDTHAAMVPFAIRTCTAQLSDLSRLPFLHARALSFWSRGFNFLSRNCVPN